MPTFKIYMVFLAILNISKIGCAALIKFDSRLRADYPALTQIGNLLWRYSLARDTK